MEDEETETDRSIAETLSKSIGFRRIDIVLDHPQKVYYSGHRISGNVHLELDEPTNALGIRLKCKGEAQVYFTDRSAGIRRKFSAFENYLHVETYVVGDGKEKSVITGGVYPFSLTLPEKLPCSFEGRYGRVRYSIRALLDVTTIYRFSTNIIPFTVAPILDLNRDPLAPLPINIKQSKMYIGQTESLTVSMSLPVRGYVPGQAIPITILMTNLSTVVVTKIRIVFKKVVSYHSTEKSRKHKEIIVEVEQPVNKDSDTYDVTFDVPAVPPTGMIHCNIIDVLYTLKVEACVDVSEWYYRMFQKNLKLRTNIVVGTVPLQNYETPQKTTDVTEDFSLHPQCTTATEEYADDTQPLKNSERVERGRSSLSPAVPLYEKSQIYRSSKPDKDDPTGDDGDSDGEVKPYSPMYRVYKFKSSLKKAR
ncbi:arrestin domain-containing protein 17-like isoform X1 [Apis laboriosa]|uniref:arrestin domain-containing protein 17-like isoform X1 n=1 Tax=Apis laboriosa TaxID=183418 RepID=UPI001CC333AB|nr:arrestin domain-containing protein 17-like isoform X1 [Apis laboriosa]